MPGAKFCTVPLARMPSTILSAVIANSGEHGHRAPDVPVNLPLTMSMRSGHMSLGTSKPFQSVRTFLRGGKPTVWLLSMIEW